MSEISREQVIREVAYQYHLLTGACDISYGTLISGIYDSTTSLSQRIDDIATTVSLIDAEVSDFSTEISSIETTTASIITVVSDLNSQYENISVNIASLNSHMTAAETKISSLQTKVSAVQSSVGNLNTRVNTTESNITTLNSNLTTLNSKHYDLLRTCCFVEGESHAGEYWGNGYISGNGKQLYFNIPLQKILIPSLKMTLTSNPFLRVRGIYDATSVTTIDKVIAGKEFYSGNPATTRFSLESQVTSLNINVTHDTVWEAYYNNVPVGVEFKYWYRIDSLS